MSSPAPWQNLNVLSGQFLANLAALAERYPEIAAQIRSLPAAQHLLRVEGDRIVLASVSPTGETSFLPNPVPAAVARQVAIKLFPGGKCTDPVAIVGLDQGFLWRALFEMEIFTPSAPGHRPPLYFLCREAEQLRIAMHLHDLRPMFAAHRVQMYCGPDAIEQLVRVAQENPEVPLPKLSVTVDARLWPEGANIDSILQRLLDANSTRLIQLQTQLAAFYWNFDRARLAQRIRNGESLRIIGITSLYTTFLQYSMRDWLDSMRSLGHETELLIEEADHHLFSPAKASRICERFKPDIIVAIDHYRGELAGIPASIPYVMWVQDRLPNIFSKAAGAAQRPLDYVIGQGRVECVHQHGYPSTRFMPAMIGTNEKRFTKSQATSSDYACDVSFVSHCSIPAEMIVQGEIERLNSPASTRLLQGIFDQLRAIYDSGKSITQSYQLEAIIRQTLASTQTSVEDVRPLIDLFTHRVNNALFRHQAIDWLVEMGVDLHLWGRGWGAHPKYARFARGVADNEKQLGELHRASRINLQVTPFGAAHQRLFDGLASGGFFLIRGVAGDQFDRCLRDLWRRCEQLGIQSDEQLLMSSDTEIPTLLATLAELDGRSVVGRGYDFVPELAVTAEEGFTRSAGTLWPEFDQVAFHSRAELQQRVMHFLGQPEEREALTVAMRDRVLECLTYRAVSKRMLKFIATDLIAAPSALAA